MNRVIKTISKKCERFVGSSPQLRCANGRFSQFLIHKKDTDTGERRFLYLRSSISAFLCDKRPFIPIVIVNRDRDRDRVFDHDERSRSRENSFLSQFVVITANGRLSTKHPPLTIDHCQLTIDNSSSLHSLLIVSLPPL